MGTLRRSHVSVQQLSARAWGMESQTKSQRPSYRNLRLIPLSLKAWMVDLSLEDSEECMILELATIQCPSFCPWGPPLNSTAVSDQYPFELVVASYLVSYLLD